jgi:membrane protease YdiL (CAAX protease family)
MLTILSASLKKNALPVYFILAYGLSWMIGIPLAVAAQRGNSDSVLFSMHYLYAYGPLLAAMIMTWWIDGINGIKELLSRILKWRVQPIWWGIALSPLVFLGGFVLVQRLILGTWFDFSLLGEVNFLPNIGAWGLLFWIFTFGFGEEIGWRGYALPRLQKNRSALSATLILAVFWAGWHLPQFFYLFDVSIAVGWLFGLVAGAILFSWLYNSTEGSLPIVAVWHGAFNFITASAGGAGLIAAILSTIVMVWAVVVIILFKPANLSHLEKQIN